MFSKITDIFFDLDHTLWDFDTNSKHAFQKIFETNFQNINLDDFIKIYVKHNQNCWKLYQNNQITQEELRFNRLKFTFTDLNIVVSEADIDFISEKYIDYLPHFTALFENTLETLDYLQFKHNLHIITNGFDKVQTLKLENSGLNKFFKSITNSEMAGAKKPNPLIYQYALNQANAQKENAIMIGDCLDADVNGALNFGMQAIYFNPNKLNCEDKIVQINNLAQLIKIF